MNSAPVHQDPQVKPPVPTLANWSRCDGIVAHAGARGRPEEREAELDIGCSHSFGVSGKACPRIVEAVRSFS